MKKVFVKWMCVDDYGRACGTIKYRWFDTEEEAEIWTKEQKGYIRVLKVAEGCYEEYTKMLDLIAEVEALKEKF